MDWEFIAPMLVGIVFIITMGGVLLLRPVAKRASALLEAMAQERTARLTAAARPPRRSTAFATRWRRCRPGWSSWRRARTSPRD